jgi:DNA mismatch endonuclease, patch repair protein
MADVMTPAQRSRCMSRIRGKNTKPEVALRRALWSEGFRYRLHAKLPGRPDISVPALRFAIFVDGCFWHGCPVHGVRPKSNSIFWTAKIEKNRLRDHVVSQQLRSEGWKVFRFWEHQVDDQLDRVVARVVNARSKRGTQKRLSRPEK